MAAVTTLCTLPASVLAEASVYVGEPELAALLGASRALHLALHAHPDADAAVCAGEKRGSHDARAAPRRSQ